jgi:formylglycine-generating enzyme required for sulfatase activity
VVQKLRRDFRESPDPAVKRNSALALLRIAPAGNTLESEVQHVVKEVLQGRAEDIVVWRDFLNKPPFATQATPELWQAVAQTEDRPRRLRGAAALAGLAATDDSANQWQKFGKDLAQDLIAVSPLELKAWSESLRPVRDTLRESLEQTYTGFRSEERRPLIEAAVLVLADHWGDDPRRLIDWLLKADTPTEFQPFVSALRQPVNDEQIRQLVSHAGGPWFAVEASNPTVQQQAEVDWKSRWRAPLNAAVCLFQFGQFERIRPLWLPATKGTGPEKVVDPTFPSYLIARFQELGAIDPEALMRLVEQLDGGAGDTAYDNNTIRQALLLVMGDFDSVRLPVAVRDNLQSKLEALYRGTPDSGVRAAAGWVWQQWRRQNGQSDDLRPLNEPGQQTPGWFVNSQQQTYVVFLAPGRFEVGDFVPEERAEPRRTVEIPYPFALATTEVTRRDFLAFLDRADPQTFRLRKEDREALEELRVLRGKDNFDPTLPINNVSWYAAAAYCNWLSQQEGLDESEWCYRPGRDPKRQDSDAENEYGPGMQLAAGCRTKRGYRLPTEEEWEYACRTETTTRFGFGHPADPRLMSRYGWTGSSSGGTLHTVAALRPNRHGLFDLHGNLWEWTMSLWDLEQASHEFDQNMTNRIVLSVGDGSRVLRGGSFGYYPAGCRAAIRVHRLPSLLVVSNGFRAARACSP